MAENFGTGVSRVLEVLGHQISNVVWQAGKPPLDSELNLMTQVQWEALASSLRGQVHSGFLLDPTRAKDDFTFYERSSNFFEMNRSAESPLIAVVNGWVIPILGTNSENGVSNEILLPAPPETDARTDVVFLEVWRALLSPSPSTTGKPSATTTFKYGNVDFLESTHTDEMIDPALGFETTKRVQVQYRIRVTSGNNSLESYPEGLGSPDIYAQGNTSSPVDGYTFTNMKSEGDVGLWRAGAGDETSQAELGSVDGYVYAVPLCAVFRRNSDHYTAISTGTPNHNGSIERSPSGYAGKLLTPTLTSSLAYDTATPTTISVTNLVGSGLDDSEFFLAGVSAQRYLILGTGANREIVKVSAVSTGASTITISERGLVGTEPKNHVAGTEIELYNERADGKYADGIVGEDVLDLRHAITFGDWDYNRLLNNAISDLITNNLKSTYKQAGVGSDSKGLVIEEVSSIVAPDGETRTYVNLVDAPNGIRQVWSDASVLQTDVSFLIDPTTATNSSSGLTTQALDASVSSTWTIGAKFNPTGFLYTNLAPINNGSAIFFSIGGADGSSGARAGIRSDLPNEVVRFVAPREMAGKVGGNKDPFKVRFLNHNRPNAVSESGTQGLYVAPTEKSNFETPYIVLGQSLIGTISDRTANLDTGKIRNLKLLDAEGLYPVVHDGDYARIYAINLDTDFDTTADTPVRHNTTTLRNLISKNNLDDTGWNSELYLVLYGDREDGGADNNGVFRVVGAGGITSISSDLLYNGAQGGASDEDPWEGEASPENWVYMIRVGSTESLFVESNAALRAELRTQTLDSRDTSTALVFTEVLNTDSNPLLPADSSRTSNIAISTTLLWPPGHGAMARVLDKVNKIGIRNPTTQYLRNPTTALDPDSITDVPLPSGETYLPVSNHISKWNGISSEGFHAGQGNGATNFGGVVADGEADKEAEAFLDVGSKTLLLRPMQRQYMKLYGHTLSTTAIGSSTYLDGATQKFGGEALFRATTGVYALPQEIMPKFGRQDIPYHKKLSSSDVYMEGINHLLLDKRSTISVNFTLLGGEANDGSSGVYPLLFATGNDSDYGGYSTSVLSDVNQSAFFAKKVALSGIKTTDFGDILKGIKLPPFFGIARLYGVYELTDFNANAPDGGKGAHGDDRETPVDNGPTNLLRKDADSYTLYIERNGGTEISESGSHTYIVTEHAIDISKIPTYVSGNGFEDFNYVVECTVFGFGLGFIDQNTFVLTRQHKGDGTLASLPSSTPLSAVEFVVPSAVSQTDEVYISGSRTVYQGDPFYTIGGATADISDYRFRYGQVSSANSYKLSTPRGQTLEDGSSAISITNRRSLQVLASMDFFTTQGTGAIGGGLHPSTYGDVGYAQYTNRIPSSPSESLPQNAPFLFTAPLDERSSYGVATLILSTTYKNFYVGSSNGGVSANLDRHLKITFSEGDTEAVFEGKDYYALAVNGATVYSNFQDAIVNFFGGYGVVVEKNGDALLFSALKKGANSATLMIEYAPTGSTSVTTNGYDIRRIAQVYTGERQSGRSASYNSQTKVNFSQGVEIPTTPGYGARDISLVGLTSRLPLGILVSDHDFLCEDPLRNGATSLESFGSKLTALPSSVGVSPDGRPYTKTSGLTGEVLQMGDGELLTYAAYPAVGGTQRYRIYRGGGAVFGAHGDVPGAPLTWLNGSFAVEGQPVLKGAVLSCRAMLVRNFEEDALSTTRSYGDEVQLLIVTQAVFSNGTSEIKVGGEISPSGFGEGYASADRYRIMGRPLVRGQSPNTPDATPAKYGE
jgi:hypothetical protein